MPQPGCFDILRSVTHTGLHTAATTQLQATTQRREMYIQGLFTAQSGEKSNAHYAFSHIFKAPQLSIHGV